MYIWRGKTRRDRRDFLLDGALLWGPRREDRDTELEDEQLRLENEISHVEYFRNETSRVMADYLFTADGKTETHLVAMELARVDKEFKKMKALKADAAKTSTSQSNVISDDLSTSSVDFDEKAMQEERKQTIYQVFRKFAVDMADTIDPAGFRDLLWEINLKMSDDEVVKLFKELDFDGGGEIDFEEFYKCTI